MIIKALSPTIGEQISIWLNIPPITHITVVIVHIDWHALVVCS